MKPSLQLNVDFGQIANRYDLWYDTPSGKRYDRLEKRAIETLLTGFDTASHLLEVGCGTGHWSNYFSDKGFKVTGVDISSKMIRIAAGKKIPNSHFEVANGRNLPFTDASFDTAAAITVLEFTLEPEKIVSEMVRCVKKGNGMLIIGVLNALNAYNNKRKSMPNSVYSTARFFSPQQIYKLLKEYGKVSLTTAGFVPANDYFLGLSPLWEYCGRLFCAEQGAFIAARIDL